MENSKEKIMTELVQVIAYLDVIGAKMIDDGNKEQAVFVAKVIKTVHNTLKFLAENSSDGK